VIRVNTELVPAIQVQAGDKLKISTGKGWSRKTYQVASLVKLADAWETDKLHGVCMRFASGEAASMEDETLVKVVNA